MLCRVVVFAANRNCDTSVVIRRRGSGFDGERFGNGDVRKRWGFDLHEA